MPKVNVYLPDELLTEVKAADLSVSQIVQKALREELKMTLRTEFVIGGRRHGCVEVFRLRDDGTDYAWLVDFGGQSRRGTLTHDPEDGAPRLLHRVLSAYLAAHT